MTVPTRSLRTASGAPDLEGKPPVVLTVAGFDPSSGAGVTADLQVFAAHGLYGTACVTALTVQSTRGVATVQSVASLVLATLRELDADLPPSGIKIGMLVDVEAVEAVGAYLRKCRGRRTPVVLDPVLVSSSGAVLLTPDGVDRLRADLLGQVEWITPNLAELAVLSGLPVGTDVEIEAAMRGLQRKHPQLHVVATGGHGREALDRLLPPGGNMLQFEGEWVQTTSTHGTGCAFSAALLARLVLGNAAAEAVAGAKAYVAEALRSAPGLGQGRGPLDLLWPLRRMGRG